MLIRENFEETYNYFVYIFGKVSFFVLEDTYIIIFSVATTIGKFGMLVI